MCNRCLAVSWLIRRAAQSKAISSLVTSVSFFFFRNYWFVPGGRLSCSLKCKESEDEAAQTSQEEFLTFPCFISADVKYLLSGLKLKLVEELTKYSQILQRDAVWEKSSKISRLPAYLAITLMRFFFKERERTNAKVLKDIKFQVI
jgi:ubiquitin carboxyl-terminal hydrolase 14